MGRKQIIMNYKKVIKNSINACFYIPYLIGVSVLFYESLINQFNNLNLGHYFLFFSASVVVVIFFSAIYVSVIKYRKEMRLFSGVLNMVNEIEKQKTNKKGFDILSELGGKFNPKNLGCAEDSDSTGNELLDLLNNSHGGEVISGEGNGLYNGHIVNNSNIFNQTPCRELKILKNNLGNEENSLG